MPSLAFDASTAGDGTRPSAITGNTSVENGRKHRSVVAIVLISILDTDASPPRRQMQSIGNAYTHKHMWFAPISVIFVVIIGLHSTLENKFQLINHRRVRRTRWLLRVAACMAVWLNNVPTLWASVSQTVSFTYNIAVHAQSIVTAFALVEHNGRQFFNLNEIERSE